MQSEFQCSDSVSRNTEFFCLAFRHAAPSPSGTNDKYSPTVISIYRWNDPFGVCDAYKERFFPFVQWNTEGTRKVQNAEALSDNALLKTLAEAPFPRVDLGLIQDFACSPHAREGDKSLKYHRRNRQGLLSPSLDGASVLHVVATWPYH